MCLGSWKGGRVSYGLLKLLFEVVEETVSEQGGRQDQLIRESLGILDKEIILPNKL